MSQKIRSLQLPRSKYLKDIQHISDEESLRCSLFVGLNLAEGLPLEEIQSKTNEVFTATDAEGRYDDDLNQLDRLVQMYSKSFDFAVTVLIITGPGISVRPFITAYQADNTFTAKNLIHLLRYEHDEGTRYALVNDLDKFLAPHGKSRNMRKRFCHRCLNPFNEEVGRSNHQKECKIFSDSIIPSPPDFIPQEILPSRNKNGTPPVKTFIQVEKQLVAPITVVVDFEASLNPAFDGCTNCAQEKSLRSSRCRCENDLDTSFTKITEFHNAIAFFYIVIDQTGKVLLEREGVSENGEAGALFLHDLLCHEAKLMELARPKRPMNVRYEQYVQYLNNKFCCICKVKYTHYDKYCGTPATLPTGYSRIVAHHCHYTGTFHKHSNSQKRNIIF